MTIEIAVLSAAALLAWVALVHIVVASGVRLGELVWSGQQPRLLDTELRVRSFVYALLLLASAYVLTAAAGVVESSLIPDRWMRSATFTATAILTSGLVYALAVGTTWERMLFAPILLLGALVGGWLTFA